MFNFLKRPINTTHNHTVTLKIAGMHCTACSINIDSSLEELDGVMLASTSYAKSSTTVSFDPKKTTIKKIIETVKKTGYEAEVAK